MFFVFGWGMQTVKNLGEVSIYHCNHCNNDRPWTLHIRRTWFTLFFIPIIPYSTQRFMICPICKNGVLLNQQQFNDLKAMAECNTDFNKNKITQEEYSNRMSQLASVNSNANSSDEMSSAGKTETQLNYLRQMKELELERERNKSGEQSV